MKFGTCSNLLPFATAPKLTATLTGEDVKLHFAFGASIRDLSATVVGWMS